MTSLRKSIAVAFTAFLVVAAVPVPAGATPPQNPTGNRWSSTKGTCIFVTAGITQRPVSCPELRPRQFARTRSRVIYHNSCSQGAGKA
jgi:hypothetical protein